MGESVKIYGLSPEGRKFLMGELRGETLYRSVKSILTKPEYIVGLDSKALLASEAAGAKEIAINWRGDQYRVSCGRRNR